ncbi:hypothetical protein Ait01nite_041800 [Actinoplanes italicus]|uniref:DUF3558 domain-containing protein n=1 Tax=Actinoplanes italicus TaxID=113567 RepID=A0A2T0K1P8_9ACTN|nr:hypothetical protein [Actinoplanes italicus]PRX16735.1 hypothetical protein CLV67_11866 [Actinoplanes italicus]GIE31135.1 hypothetical protein Ait01nite_041800 [Actinoplanes italicus]
MKHRLVALTAVVAVAFTGGCGAIGSAASGGAPEITSTTPAKKATPAPTTDSSDSAGSSGSSSKSDSVKDSGDIPDPCTLLSKAEVVDLTDREITQIDEDGGAAGDVTRYCQWQQSGGQLAVFLSRTTAEDFQVTVDQAEPVSGVGEDAFAHSGHLYVLYGTVQIDVYSRGASDAKNLSHAKAVAKTLIPRI